MRLGITGAAGFLGRHVRCYLHPRTEHQVTCAGKDTFAQPRALADFVAGCDGIIHLAGSNRGPDGEVEGTNIELARRLVDALRSSDGAPAVAFANSTQHDQPTPYGRSKQAAAHILASWAADAGAAFADCILPNVFGEGGRPFYNSVVATFAHQLAHGQDLVVEIDRELELLHAQQVAALMINVLEEPDGVCRRRLRGEHLTVSSLADLLREMGSTYRAHRIPDLRQDLHLDLFNTLRASLPADYYPVALPLYADERGALFEAVKTEHGGQAFLSTTRPGVTRGNHFHYRKVERFVVVRGEAVIRLRPLLSADTQEVSVTGESPAYVDIPTLHTHSITNIGESELLTLFWAHELFDPEHPDTVPEPV